MSTKMTPVKSANIMASLLIDHVADMDCIFDPSAGQGRLLQALHDENIRQFGVHAKVLAYMGVEIVPELANDPFEDYMYIVEGDIFDMDLSNFFDEDDRVHVLSNGPIEYWFEHISFYLKNILTPGAVLVGLILKDGQLLPEFGRILKETNCELVFTGTSEPSCANGDCDIEQTLVKIIKHETT
jgi:hypothetical protein